MKFTKVLVILVIVFTLFLPVILPKTSADTGAWYLTSSEMGPGFPNDFLTFIEADNPYFKGNIVMAQDRYDESQSDWFIRWGSTFEVDYKKKVLKIIQPYNRPTYYGIFEIDESGDRAILKIEYQKDSYPANFTENALTYIEKSRGFDE